MANKRNHKVPDRKSNKKKNADARKLNGGKTEKDDDAPSTGGSKMTLCTLPAVGCRSQIRERRPGRPPTGKRLTMVRDMPAKVRSAFRRSLDPCDNSNDSGLGFEHHTDPHHQIAMPERVSWSGEKAEPKRPRLDIKLEHDEVNDGYCFPETIRTCKDSTSLIRTAPAGSVPSLSMNNNQTSTSGRAVPRCIPLSNRQSSSAPVALTAQLNSTSRYMDVSLTIVKQPEQQHRARYQTEGSRGAVKDREGSGFPIVQLTGYYQPTTLQVFIGTDVGKVAPHMFYQACKVSGKNSTPCIEKKIDGTCVIELQLDPSKEMSATCDCVGILKERNVDVEHRFPDQLGNRSKKKSTRCRMIFRTTLTHEDGTLETLQVCSQPIVCTQPPGVPEICKKSLTSCPASGGLELFVLGKNFLKDTKVFFQQVDDDRHIRWEQAVVPDKEYLQQTHFVCVVPPYCRPDITEPVTVRLCVVSSGKTSESHQFVYTPVNGAIPSGGQVDPTPTQAPFFNKMLWSSSVSKREQDLGMMPPPESNLVPLSTTRRSSISIPSTSEVHSPPLHTLKQEFMDENSQSSVIDAMDIHQERFRHISESSLDVHHSDSNLSMMNENSIDMLSHNGYINGDSSSEHHRNPLTRQMCENSMDVNLSDSQMSCITEDSSCSTVLQCTTNSDRLVLAHPTVMHSSQQLSPTNRRVNNGGDELKVIDLRMKMPMATVADLVNSNAPSMATLHSFGVTEASALPAQSAQSVENFLTNIESKPTSIPPDNICTEQSAFQQKLLSPPVIHKRLTAGSDSEPVFLTSQRNLLSSTIQNEAAMHIVAKSEAAAVGEQTIPQQTNTITRINSTLETTIATTINTEKLDQLVNSTVESHMGSPTRSEAGKDVLLSSKLVATDSIITSRDVMLNSRPTLMVPPIITTTLPSAELTHSHQSPTLSPEVILNSQISPSLMCQNTQDIATSLNSSVVESTLLSTNQNPLLVATEPEKAVILKAAVDFLETQKKLSELEHLPTTITMNGTNSSQLTGNNFVQSQFVGDNKADFAIPVPVKEMTGVEKKNEDRMIPQSFTSLTENELINLINPSCFDQV